MSHFESEFKPDNRPWPRAVVFDLDGTLIDSAPDIALCAERALADYPISIDAARARRWVGDGSRRFIERALGSVNADADDATIDRLNKMFSDLYAQTPCRETQVFDGVIDALQTLRERGVRLAICTNKPHDIAVRVVEALGLDQYVDVLIGAGRYPLKPAPDAILACLEALDCVPAEALYVGDMSVDREAGHAAGLPVLLAGFGYARAAIDSLGAEGSFEHWRDIDTAIGSIAASAAGSSG